MLSPSLSGRAYVLALDDVEASARSGDKMWWDGICIAVEERAEVLLSRHSFLLPTMSTVEGVDAAYEGAH